VARRQPCGYQGAGVVVPERLVAFRPRHGGDGGRVSRRRRARRDGVEPGLLEELREDQGRFDVDPQEIDSWLSRLSLGADGCGTHFIIKPVSPLLADDIDGEAAAGRTNGAAGSTPLRKALLGFSNTLARESEPGMRASFRNHRTEELMFDMLSDEEFFTPDEFAGADHQITGAFDEFGQFRGDVSVYGEKIAGHVIPWPGAAAMETQCGPFTIRLAAGEGEGRRSIMPREERARLAQKTERLGGLYIYRNGIGLPIRLPLAGKAVEVGMLKKGFCHEADECRYRRKRQVRVTWLYAHVVCAAPVPGTILVAEFVQGSCDG